MFYIAKCKECNHLLHSSDSHTLKQKMASHRSVSHKENFVFVADVPLKDFENFTITRIRNKYAETMLKKLLETKGYYKFYRNLEQLAERTQSLL